MDHGARHEPQAVQDDEPHSDVGGLAHPGDDKDVEKEQQHRDLGHNESEAAEDHGRIHGLEDTQRQSERWRGGAVGRPTLKNDWISSGERSAMWLPSPLAATGCSSGQRRGSTREGSRVFDVRAPTEMVVAEAKN